MDHNQEEQKQQQQEDSGRCRQSRVAIVGTGLAGLTTAHLLHNDEKKRYSVTLFEQASSLSFDAASVAVKNDSTGVAERVDLPMRAGAGGYYANLLRMYEYLSVPIHPIRFFFVFSKAVLAADGTPRMWFNNRGAGEADRVGSDPESYFVHASNLHQTPPPWPGTRSVLAHVAEILFLIVCQFWFSLACFVVRPRVGVGLTSSTTKSDHCETFEEYLQRIWLPRRFVSHYLLPLMSSVSTCTHNEILAFPASDLVNYKKLSHGQQHYTVCGGVARVQSKLVQGLTDIRLNARVVEVIPTDASTVTIRWVSATDPSAEPVEQTFDRVVMTVSPDVAGFMFKPLRSVLHSIPTRRVESSVISPEGPQGEAIATVVGDNPVQGSLACSHHAGDVLPSQTLTLRSLLSDTAEPRTEALHTMPSGVVVSTCPLDENSDYKRTLHTARFTRTLRNTQSRIVVETIMGRAGTGSKKADSEFDCGWKNGQDNVFLAGAWCWDGMVLLEGCIVSAMSVAHELGVSVPWERA